MNKSLIALAIIGTGLIASVAQAALIDNLGVGAFSGTTTHNGTTVVNATAGIGLVPPNPVVTVAGAPVALGTSSAFATRTITTSLLAKSASPTRTVSSYVWQNDTMGLASPSLTRGQSVFTYQSATPVDLLTNPGYLNNDRFRFTNVSGTGTINLGITVTDILSNSASLPAIFNFDYSNSDFFDVFFTSLNNFGSVNFASVNNLTLTLTAMTNDADATFTLVEAFVPEPNPISLMGLGIFALAAFARRKVKKATV